MFLFYLIPLLYGAHSLPLDMQPLTMLSIKDTVVKKKNDTASGSDNLLAQIKSDPEQFIAQVQNLDPDSIKTIISLLEALRETSVSRENDLITDLNNKKTALADSNTRLINAADALDAANKAVQDAKNVLSGKEADAASALDAHNQAKDDHNAKTGEKNSAQKAHDDEVPSLDDEQRVLTDVIDMMKGLHEKHKYLYTVGTCQPSGTYVDSQCCESGYHEITSSADCAAGKNMAASGGTQGGDGTWNSRPSGCFWHQGNGYIHFNTLNTVGHNLHGDDKVICKKTDYAVGTCQPTGTYATSQCCPNGFEEIKNSADCAAAKIKVANGGTQGGDGTWNSRPSGCFWHQGNGYIHFNKLNTVGHNLHGDDKVLCKT